MVKNLSLFIGYRYTRSKRREGYVSFISAFSLGAMSLGVAALIIVLSVMNGFDNEIKSRLLKVLPHITVAKFDGISHENIQLVGAQLATDPAVEHIVPMVQSFVVISQGDEQMGVNLQGIDTLWPTADLLSEVMISGELEQLTAGQFQVIVGAQIARKMGLMVGDTLQITLPQVSVTPAGIFPRIKRVVVSGIFQVGAQADGSVIFMHQADARTLLRLGDKFLGFQVQLKDGFGADNWILRHAQVMFPDLQWRSWTSTMASLFKAMAMEKIVVSLLLSVIIAVAAFNIIASLVLMVAEKRRDIAVIRTMGATSGLVIRIFIVQGMTVAVMGVCVGTVIGSAVAYFIGSIVTAVEHALGIYFFDPSIYLISALPSKLLVSDVAVVVISALVISLLATLYPAWRAGQILPAEALRYDH
ncbi:MAG TPA: lipoprotein-releasing ABC transporter permease subunit [Porticoccaceae bacterium]|jgi:lipoprotein-releasing system permease protein|nr:lipoprotein-releasing ABC transporter permease subunit [Porticoccaceae bacterium]